MHENVEGLIGLIHNNKAILIFQTNVSIYSLATKADSSHLAVIYIRYLIDMC